MLAKSAASSTISFPFIPMWDGIYMNSLCPYESQ